MRPRELLALVVVLTVGCSQASAPEPTGLGERYAAHGSCPPGELCSARTPGGLLMGPTTVFGATGGLAVGGRVDVVYVEADGLAPADVRAELADPTVATVVGTPTDPDRIEILGLRNGTTLLRLVDATDGTLLDRATLRVDTVASVAAALFARDGIHIVNVDAVLDGDHAFAAPIIENVDGEPLVDDLMGVASVAGAVQVLELEPSGSALIALAPSTATIPVHAGGMTRAATVARADGIESLVSSTALRGAAQSYGGVCFFGRAAGNVLLVGGVVAVASDPSVSLEPVGASGCFATHGPAIAHVTVTGTRGAASAAATVVVNQAEGL